MQAMRTTMLVAAVGLLAGCTELEAPTYRVGVDLSETTWAFFDEQEGIHPSDVTLINPNNPFAEIGVSNTAKWEIESGANDSAAFYSWAMVLIREPTGEAQYYAATHLEGLLNGDEIDDGDRLELAVLAGTAYYSVLENFPGSVTYDASGSFFFPLAPLAYDGFLRVAGFPPPGFMKVDGPDGEAVVAVVSI